ncbi:MAG: DUF421 domain-containing protein [Clostridia bacterium]|nr:DUF421 domain-containing protein [Clostridia bacterium]
MSSIVIRTLIIYILLSFSLRIMGKRQLGELDVAELVSTLLISEIAAIPIDDPDIPILNAIIPIFFIISIEIIVSSLKNKSEKLKRVVEGTPVYIIYKGRVLQKNLIDNRISINELLSSLRSQGVSDIGEVEYGIIEPSGTLSVIKTDSTPLSHPIIIDTSICEDTLKSTGYSIEWLMKVLKEKNLCSSDVFLMTVNDDGEINIIQKDGPSK